MLSRTRAYGALVIAACMVWSGAGEAAASGGIQRIPEGLIFEGFIEQRAVDALDGKLRRGDVLLIGSGGGNPVAALRLGNIVVSRDVRVVVNGICLNACALYVFLPARQHEAELGFSVRFGPSPFSIEELAQRRPELFDSAEKENIADHVAAYRSLLGSSTRIQQLLECSDRLLQPDFAGATRGAQIDDGVFRLDFKLPVKFNQAAVSPSVLAEHHAAPLGEYLWPTSAEGAWRQGVEEDAGAPIVWIDTAADCGIT